MVLHFPNMLCPNPLWTQNLSFPWHMFVEFPCVFNFIFIFKVKFFCLSLFILHPPCKHGKWRFHHQWIFAFWNSWTYIFCSLSKCLFSIIYQIVDNWLFECPSSYWSLFNLHLWWNKQSAAESWNKNFLHILILVSKVVSIVCYGFCFDLFICF